MCTNCLALTKDKVFLLHIYRTNTLHCICNKHTQMKACTQAQTTIDRSGVCTNTYKYIDTGTHACVHIQIHIHIHTHTITYKGHTSTTYVYIIHINPLWIPRWCSELSTHFTSHVETTTHLNAIDALRTHVRNFASPLSLRLSCKRMRNLCPCKNQHVRLFGCIECSIGGRFHFHPTSSWSHFTILWW